MNREDWEGLLNSHIITAYSSGLSVVEITRALGKLRIDHVHNLLRDTGTIAIMDRTEYRRTYPIHGKLTAALRHKGYTFGRWCLGWHFDPDTAAAELRDNPEDGPQRAVHDALRRDFPLIYFLLYGSQPPQTPQRTPPLPHPSVIIEWDQGNARYNARVPEYSEVVGIGSDWTEALEDAKMAYCFLMSIYKLNFAIKRNGIK